MDIRLLTRADVESYRDIRLEALKTNPEAFGSSYEEAVTRTVKQLAETFPVTNNNFIVGAFSKEEKLIGTAGFRQEQAMKMKHKGMVWGMYVTPDYRGQGISRLLLQQLIAEAKKLQDLEQINLVVVTINDAAKVLYERLGFEHFGTEKRALRVNDKYYDEDYMVLSLQR
ncbi:GNAT family N-acetyltransferase [Bacillus sp. 165]|uniref:GNAT family N-acetyltransferase n=1 Tax=Bacillus sp. 165 TaxID=1529117 RepID=UPI001ADA64F2|nr:GNAT family N-acetyltransferase [Bacillus sp. 165]MBO9131453.1 GNAT family N-acetyltransferase [Bacillus sp. 165]